MAKKMFVSYSGPAMVIIGWAVTARYLIVIDVQQAQMGNPAKSDKTAIPIARQSVEARTCKSCRLENTANE